MKKLVGAICLILTLLLAAPCALAEGEDEGDGQETQEQEAQEQETQETETEETTAEVPFEADIAGTWYHDAAVAAYRNGWMDGVGDGADESRFNGNDAVSRGEAVDAIWRMMGSPVSNVRIGYSDMDAYNPYRSAIDWAGESKVATGVGDGRFGWQDPVTREQLALMLYRCARMNGMGFSGTWMLLLETEDRPEVHDWAYEAVCWLYINKVMRGSGGYYLPAGHTTRAELATVLVRVYALTEAE